MRDFKEEVKAKEAAEKFLKQQITGANYEPMQATPRLMTTEERLADIFQYHDDPAKIPNYTAIRSAAKHLAEVIVQNSPPSADQTTAIRCVREAVMWANAAIALDGRSF